MKREPTHIIVYDLNKLKWLFPNQIFMNNILKYSKKVMNILQDNDISFSVASYEYNEDGDYFLLAWK